MLCFQEKWISVYPIFTVECSENITALHDAFVNTIDFTFFFFFFVSFFFCLFSYACRIVHSVSTYLQLLIITNERYPIL